MAGRVSPVLSSVEESETGVILRKIAPNRRMVVLLRDLGLANNAPLNSVHYYFADPRPSILPGFHPKRCDNVAVTETDR